MNQTPEILALQHALAIGLTHRQTLGEALEDLRLRDLKAAELESLSKADRRLLDQFAYRYTRLQDDMGARLMPAVLRALQEEIASLSMIDRLNRLEQLGWLPSAEEWADLRRVRNEFAHDYPDTAEERFDRLQLALTAAQRLLEILMGFEQHVQQRFPGISP
ncbi:hypothetical protein CCR95_21380 [Thiocystis minor]|uniref:hypothetical protein n=1 Tax=Thiocystis minor TaxID=61597 RepID=UPI00191176E8|nr:hypothetical protein [Thiocystis minor]MBK5966554.1 hypothetical protein [Thiocystis minor]